MASRSSVAPSLVWTKRAPVAGTAPPGRKSAANPGCGSSSARFVAVLTCWLRVTGMPAFAKWIASARRRESGRRPPISFAASHARPQPEIVPATVFAATPPRKGIAPAMPRSRYQSIDAACAAAPHASMPRGSRPGTCTSQNESPPIEFMCG